jgi:NAD(P)-dependent dehydrogenase (short-subunit alcohol dehydrogenase family)
MSLIRIRYPGRAYIRTPGKKLDVLIYNAAMGGLQSQAASSVNQKVLKSVFETNFFAAIKVTQKFPPLLMKATQPRVVNVFSELGSLSIVFHMQDKGHYPDGLCPAY